jgi:SAM-dependent methyltransferase
MVKYVTTAVALKCFSSGPAMRALYRRIGNQVGNRRRSAGAMPAYYPERMKRMLRLQKQYNMINDGDHILELGTGWVHWEALTLRLFYEIKATLFDVWDNRQLGGLKNYIRQLGLMLNEGFGLSAAKLGHARLLIEKILKIESFDELYQLLGFEYVVEGSGSLRRLPSKSYDLVVSGGVLEHVKREALPDMIAEMRRLLKPGGWAVHSIDTADHLEHYDRKVSPKMYLTFSEEMWARLFENEVQYINRIQRGEWIELFRSNGFDLIEEEARRVDISGLQLADRYVAMNKADLECTFLQLAFCRGPGQGTSSALSRSRVCQE